MFSFFTKFKGSLSKIPAPVKRKVLFPKFCFTFGRGSYLLRRVEGPDRDKFICFVYGRVSEVLNEIKKNLGIESKWTVEGGTKGRYRRWRRSVGLLRPEPTSKAAS